MKKEKSVITEVGIFSIGIGVLLGIAAFFTITGVRDNAPYFFGMQRKYGIGVPIAVVAVLNFASGVIVLATRSKLAIVLSIVCAVLVALVYFAIMILSGAGIGINLITIVVCLVPILVISRGKIAIKETESDMDIESTSAIK